MIHLNFSIRNPFRHNFRNVHNSHGKISQYKAWEFEILETTTLIHFEFSFTARQDHAGVCLGFGIFGHEVLFQIYDIRHWDEEWGIYK